MSDSSSLYSCSEVRQRLDDYLDQELPPDVFYSILEHLNGCSTCSAISQQGYQALAQMRAAAQRLTLPPDLAARISERLQSFVPPSGR